MSITYTITSPVLPCVLNYTITTTGSDDEVLDQIIVPSDGLGSRIVGGILDVCSTNLIVTATPVTSEGDGPDSASAHLEHWIQVCFCSDMTPGFLSLGGER